MNPNNVTSKGAQSQNQLSEKVLDNLKEIELDLDTSGEYFKPQAGTTYDVEIDIEKHRIVLTDSEKFKTANGKPLKQYQFIIRHVGNNVEQKWSITSKALLRQLMTEIRQNHKLFQITRNGEGPSTTYNVVGATVNKTQ